MAEERKPYKRPDISILKAVTGGDRREALIALRDRLAAELDHPVVMPRDVALITKQLTEIIRELDSLPNAAEVSPLVDIARRRESRRSAASV
jgi:hypothetical protein